MSKNKNRSSPKTPSTAPSKADQTQTKSSSYHGTKSKGKPGNGGKPGIGVPTQPKIPILGRNSQSYDSIRSNDITWWSNSPMYADATRVPFNRIYGDPIQNLGVQISDHGATPAFPYVGWKDPTAVPGVMVLKFRPMMGTVAGGSNAPLNRAFTSLYGDIYSRTTGAMQFQQADLALFMTSLSSIAMLIALVKRALGVSTLYSGKNYYYPIHLLNALGFSPYTVIGHQDEIRMALNNSVLSFNNLKIPDFMSIYKRWYSLCHNVFADEDDVQSQLFVFLPRNVYQYVDHTLSPPTAGYLRSVELDQGPRDVSYYLDLIQTLLTDWRNSSDLGLISGSIQRAFSDNNLIVLDYVNSGEVLVPVPDRNMLWEINNATTMRLDPSTLDIHQDSVHNYLTTAVKQLYFDPSETTDSDCLDTIMSFRQSQILNSFDAQTDEEFIMEATRLMAIPCDITNANLEHGVVEYFNTEVMDSFEMWQTVWNPVARVIYERQFEYSTYAYIDWNLIVDPDHPDIATTYQREMWDVLSMMSRFKHAPRWIPLTPPLEGELPMDSGAFWISDDIADLYKYTTVDRQSLIALNEAALQSVYATVTL